MLMSFIIAALTALGFVYWQASIAASLLLLSLGYLAYRKWKELNRRFYCQRCGIDLPNDMVREA